MTRFSRCVAFAALAALPCAAQQLFPAELVPTSCLSGGTAINAGNGILVDLDQDGDADLFGLHSGGVMVCMASGGTFLPGTCIATVQPVAAAAADLDGDGDQDVVVLLAASVAVFLNNGSGGFPSTPPVIGVGGSFIRIGRMNSDAIPDLLISGYGTPSQILFGTGGGSFVGPYPGPTFSTFQLTLNDDDLDGDDDVHAIAAGNFVTYRNNGTGGFAAPIVRFAVPSLSLVAAFADVNVDGFPDAVAAGISPGTGGSSFVKVALGGAGGVLTPGPTQSLGIALTIVSVAFADFDGDGDPDLLAWTNSYGSEPGPIQSLNTGGNFGPAVRLNEALLGGVAVGDVTGDGLPDALFFGVTGMAALEPGVASAGLAHPTMVPCGYNGYGFAVADLDADGRADAITSFNDPSVAGVGVTTFLNLDSGPAPSQTFQTVNWVASIATGDWNRDGTADVLLGPTGSDVRMCLGGAGGSLAAPVSTPAASTPYTLITADMNHDGNLDVVMEHPAGLGHFVMVYPGNGAGGIGPGVGLTSICPTPIASSCAPNPAIAVDDIDQDGNLDLVVAIAVFGAGPGSYSVYLGNASGTFGPGSHVSCGTTILTPTLVVRDVNGDTIPDLLLNQSSAALQVRLGIGGGAFGSPATFAMPPQIAPFASSPPAVGDLNGDGFPDLAYGNGTILLNDGAGGFLPHAGVVLPQGTVRVALADVDRDLKHDLVFSATYPKGWLSVFRNLTPCNAVGYTYGFGCPGSGGFVPSLSARGCASPGGSFVLDIEHGLGGAASAAFVVGPGTTNVQIGGGCGVLIQLAGSFVAPFPLFGPSVPGQGRASIPVLIPPAIAPGTSLAVQAAILDPASPFQWSASNGLALTIQ